METVEHISVLVCCSAKHKGQKLYGAEYNVNTAERTI